VQVDVNPGRQEIEDMILDYLRERPGAADTVEGIAQWWILHQRHLQNRQLVERACERLVLRGVMGRATNADGTTVYFARLRQSDKDGGSMSPR
jgi:hypothetical protein